MEMDRDAESNRSDAGSRKSSLVNGRLGGRGGGGGGGGRGVGVGALGSADGTAKVPDLRWNMAKSGPSESDTDSSIFALGEAALQLDNLDDVLTGVDLIPSLDEEQERYSSSSVARGRRPSRLRSASIAPIRGGGSSSEGVQVCVVWKKLPGEGAGEVPLRLMQGPVVGGKRRVRVTVETQTGARELLTEFEATEDCDVSRTVDRIPASVLLNLGLPGFVDRRQSIESYDNLKSSFCERESNKMEGERQRLLDAMADCAIDYDVISGDEQRQETKIDEKMRTSKHVSFSNEVPDSQGQGQESTSKIPFRKRFESMTEDEIRPYLIFTKHGTPETEEEEGEEEGEEEEEDEGEEQSRSVCWSCAKLIKSKGKTMPKSLLLELSKGTRCLTSSEVNCDDQGGLSSSPQAMLANYALMLAENRPRFVETMFRAVKLNNVGVTRLLCSMIGRRGLRLGHRDFRETESSATILHVALLYNHHDIVDLLLGLGDRELILARYETSEYRNQTSLHVAVANGNPDLVERLLLALDPIDRSTLVNTLADGHYFKTQHPHGQLCLTAAAWAGNGHVIKTLVKHGGDLRMKNSSGNTLLHSIILQSSEHPTRSDYETLLDTVWQSAEIWAETLDYDTRYAEQREMEKGLMQVSLFKDLLTIRNNDGYTPLALATTKNSRFFRHMINFEKIYKIPQNRLGSIAWVTYDVTDITSFARGSYNKFSVLHILAHNSQHLSRHANLDDLEEDFMEMEPVKTLLIRKWDVYRWIYILWFLVHLFYMVILTAVTAEEINTSAVGHLHTIPHAVPFLCCPHPCPPANLTSTASPASTSQPPRMGFVVFLILPVIYLVLELLDLFGSAPYRIHYMTGQNYPRRLVKSVKSEWTITGNGPYRMVAVGFSVCTVYWFVLYVTRSDSQDVGLALSLLLGWIFVLFFSRGCRVTCRFSIMIQKMFFRDLIYFLTVYGIVLVGFSFAMKAMMGLSSISKVFYGMMSVVTDLDQKQTNQGSRHPTFARLMLIFYAIIAVILLMNMLIAMMNTSYETVRVTRCNLWRQQQLSILLMIERRFFWLRWICRKSERDIWRKPDVRSAEERCFVDVTMLHMPGYKG